MCNKQSGTFIDVKITDIVLTPLTCAALINEVIKFLIYQKSQVPYPYNWLQSVVTRRRKCTKIDDMKQNNLSVENHYKVASLAYDTVEAIMSNVKQEFKKGANLVKEILIIFGTTPYTPKEVFRINIPIIHEYHIEANHLKSLHKSQQKILRNIFLSQDWLRAMDHICPTTNMYIMLKKHAHGIQSDDAFFVPVRDYSIPKNSLYVTINLDYQNEKNYECCSNLSVYNDVLKTSDKYSSDGNKVSYNLEDYKVSYNLEDCWSQAKVHLKGYKDCFINKVSVTELF